MFFEIFGQERDEARHVYVEGHTNNNADVQRIFRQSP